MSVQYYLKENALTSDPDDYNAIVVTKGTTDLDDLATMMIQQGSTLTPEDIQAAFESMQRAVVALLNQGFRVTTPLAVLSPSVRGIFVGSEDAYDPQRHTLRLNSRTYKPLEKTWRNSAQTAKIDGSGRTAPVPKAFFDVVSDTRNATVTPGGVGVISGQNLKLEANDPGQGVFFVGDDDSATRAPLYVRVKPGELIFTIPALPPGDYEVRVSALVPGSQDKVRCGELERTLTVT